MAYLIYGFLLIVPAWILGWAHLTPLSIYYFPPLWLGYILAINGASELLFKDSLIRRMRASFLMLFVISIPMWWFFEYMNTFLENWHYLIPGQMSSVGLLLLKSISFSTVIPAVFSAAFLFLKRFGDRSGEKGKGSATTMEFWKLVLLGLTGVIAFPLMIVHPRIFFPLVWIAPFLIIDPINYHLGFPSIIGALQNGRKSIITAFALGTLFTGFFWEFWNFYAFPKWEYTIPYFDFLRIFEMPILGYIGYLPFGLAIFSFTYLIFGLLRKWVESPSL